MKYLSEKANNIVIIGFMGVGKGTVARALAKKTYKFNIDTDDLIESMQKQKIKFIFKQKGEEHFRKLERQCAIWMEFCVRNTIISTGGGFFVQENIKKLGKVVYLKSSFDGIIKRLQELRGAKIKFAKRPLLQDLDKARELYNSRIKTYEKICDIVVDVENKKINTISTDILKQIKDLDENN